MLEPAVTLSHTHLHVALASDPYSRELAYDFLKEDTLHLNADMGVAFIAVWRSSDF